MTPSFISPLFIIPVEPYSNVCETKAFPSLNYPSSQSVQFSTRKLDGKTGSESGLLSLASKRSAQTVPPDQLSGSTPTDDVSTVQPSGSTYNFSSCYLIVHQGGNTLTAQVVTAIQFLTSLGVNMIKIDSDTNEVNRFSRSSMGHQIQHEVPRLRQDTTDSLDVTS